MLFVWVMILLVYKLNFQNLPCMSYPNSDWISIYTHRSISKPPRADLSSAISLTWITNTEFFVAYLSSQEQKATVICLLLTLYQHFHFSTWGYLNHQIDVKLIILSLYFVCVETFLIDYISPFVFFLCNQGFYKFWSIWRMSVSYF